ncbi:hypothetical protein [Massilia luteola]|uniref:NACHT domain-containing protein n=1 Tax=Massilia luteola TaxID=3081751 RepID=UPI002ACC32EE|nr:hypothetical protein [Massilia sp. Gc5]
MGKTTLLKWLANAPGFIFCTARKLINHARPDKLLGDAHVLVIDALDELSTHREGDAVDLVLQRLGELDNPRFILSCRVADWRSATGTGAILELYNEKPLELHLEPFDDSDTLAYLGQQMGIEAAEVIVNHFTSRGLQGFLGNPQTLYLVSRIAGQESLPRTKSELFERAVDVLRLEHNEAKSGKELSREATLNAAGAAFAGLIISGNEAIVRTASAYIGDGDLQLAELGSVADRDDLDAVLRTRLFKSNGVDRFTYWHRTIGEYLAARWLRTTADTPRKQRRLMYLFHGSHLVPSSLRGVHAWLARDHVLAPAVITIDPMGVVEYGDADDLTADQAHLMLEALSALAIENPFFSKWEPYSARGIGHPALIEDVRCLINAQQTPVRLRQFILEAVKGTRIAPELSGDLRTLVLDPDAVFINRSAAGNALIGVEDSESQDWPTTMRALHTLGDALSVRLAIELMDKIGYEQFNDELIADLVLAYGRQRDRTLGVLMGLERHLPDHRLGGVLDRYTRAVAISGNLDDTVENAELTGFAYDLISRHVRCCEVEVKRLWSWLQPLDSDIGAGFSSGDELALLFQADHSLRLDLLRLVLLDHSEADSVRTRAWTIHSRLQGVWPTAEEIIVLFESLDPSNCDDQLWQELVQLTHHDHETGAEVRAAARPFARNRADMLCWLDGLVEPPSWKAEQTRRDSEYRQRQADQQAEFRTHLISRIDEVRQGQYGAIITLAKAYLGLFRDVDRDATQAHERIEKWLGHDIGVAASLGFETFLTSTSLRPTADEIAVSAVNGQHWEAAYIIVAALAERHRKGLSFTDLPDESLLAGLFELRHTSIHEYAKIAGLDDAVEAAVRSRGLWVVALHRYYEPQLKMGYANGNLYTLMRSDKDSVLATELAADWLVRFPDLPTAVEEELIDRLIISDRYDVLRAAAATGLASTDAARRRNWLAVSFITDFDSTVRTIESGPVDAELLWHVWDRTKHAQGRPDMMLPPLQLEWLISHFRYLWPVVSPPRDGWSGDRNAWDATEHISHLIRRLGNDPDHETSAALSRLAAAPSDGYTETVQSVAAEQRRIRVESTHTPPTLETIASIVRDNLPLSAPDLRAFLVEELAVVQAKIKSDDVESWRGFYDDAEVPHQEERCRDHLLLLLRQGATGITFTPEAHVAADKEVDIACSISTLRLPIEVKGQWHAELWRAADSQLARLYAKDWRADGHGIYLVLWFGNHVAKNKRLRSPGRGIDSPRTPEQLREMLASTSRAVQDGRIEVVVIDLSRPERSHKPGEGFQIPDTEF